MILMKSKQKDDACGLKNRLQVPGSIVLLLGQRVPCWTYLIAPPKKDGATKPLYCMSVKAFELFSGEKED